jgi:hypothetical protein
MDIKNLVNRFSARTKLIFFGILFLLFLGAVYYTSSVRATGDLQTVQQSDGTFVTTNTKTGVSGAPVSNMSEHPEAAAIESYNKAQAAADAPKTAAKATAVTAKSTSDLTNTVAAAYSAA